MIDIEDLEAKVDHLPSLPEILHRLLAMARDPDVAPRDIVEVVKHDDAITMNVLKLCNSSHYGMPRRITSVHEAMVYVGTDALINLVLAGCVSNLYEQPYEGYGMERRQMWRQAVGSAISAQKVAEGAAKDLAGVAFTAGLLHDVGKIILDVFVAEEFQKILGLVEKEGMSFLDAEMAVLGYNHAQVGGLVAESWKLPEEIVEAIRFHHEPASALQHPKLVAIVHIGDIMSISFGIGIGSDGLAYAFEPQALELLELKPEDLYKLSLDFYDGFKKAEDLLAYA